MAYVISRLNIIHQSLTPSHSQVLFVQILEKQVISTAIDQMDPDHFENSIVEFVSRKRLTSAIDSPLTSPFHCPLPLHPQLSIVASHLT